MDRIKLLLLQQQWPHTLTLRVAAIVISILYRMLNIQFVSIKSDITFRSSSIG